MARKQTGLGVLRAAFKTGCAALCVWLASLPPEAAKAETIIRMPAGGFRTIEPARPFTQVVNRTPEILAIEEDRTNHSFRIRALSSGEGIVDLHSVDGRGRNTVRSFRVVAQGDRDPKSEPGGHQSGNHAMASESLGPWFESRFQALRATPWGDRHRITGSLASLEEFHTLEQFAARGLVDLIPEYKISAELLNTIIADINERLAAGSGAQVSLVRSGRSVIATADDPNHQIVQKIIERYSRILPSFDKDRSGNPYPESQIRVTMHLVESTEDSSTEGGQKFSGAHFPLTGQIGSSGLEQAPFQYQLRYLSSHLATRLLEQPSVMALSGSTAELQSGGDLAYQASVNEHGVATQFRNYGLLAKVTPRTQHDGDIKLDLDLEISDPTGSDINATNQTLNRRRVRSALILQDGMSRLVARVHRQKKENGKSGLPVLSDIPVVSWVVGSRGKSTKLQELWIFVSATSDLYQPFADSAEDLDDLMGDR